MLKNSTSLVDVSTRHIIGLQGIQQGTRCFNKAHYCQEASQCTVGPFHYKCGQITDIFEHSKAQTLDILSSYELFVHAVFTPNVHLVVILCSHIVHTMFTQLLAEFKFLFKHCSLGVHAVFILCSRFVHLVGKSWKKGNYFWKVDNLKIQKQLYSLMESDVIRSNSWTQNEHQVNTKWTMHEQNENTTKNSSELLVNNVWPQNEHKGANTAWTKSEHTAENAAIVAREWIVAWKWIVAW